MNRAEALNLISDGHAVYGEEQSQEIFEALGVPWKDSYAFPLNSDPPGTLKGLTMFPDSEGIRGSTALFLGSQACSHYKLEPKVFMGRGFQGQEYAGKLRMHFLTQEAEGGRR